MSSLSPGACGCASYRQGPSLEHNASMATARAVGTCLACKYMCQQRPSLERNASTVMACTVGRRWVYGDPIRWDPKVRVTCPRVGHVSVCAEGMRHWVVTKTCHRVGVSSSCPDDTSPRTDGSKETSVEATGAAPCQQQVLQHGGTALGMQLSMRRVCGDGAIDVGGIGGGGGARHRHGAVHAQGSACMVSVAPGDVPKCVSMSPCVL